MRFCFREGHESIVEGQIKSMEYEPFIGCVFPYPIVLNGFGFLCIYLT